MMIFYMFVSWAFWFKIFSGIKDKTIHYKIVTDKKDQELPINLTVWMKRSFQGGDARLAPFPNPILFSDILQCKTFCS